MKVSKNTSGSLWGLIKVGISIQKQTPGPPSGFLVKIINRLEDMTIKLYQVISKMIQIRSKLQKSGAYWGHCRQWHCPGL